MDVKPETFFVGIVDFFSVLLPGAVLTALLQPTLKQALFGSLFPNYSGEAAGWAMFLFSSYLFGHFVAASVKIPKVPV